MRSVRTILLIEDEIDLLEVMAFALQREGYEVLAAADSAEAELLLERGLPDLVVADMMLPGPSGFYVVRLVADRSEGRVPAIMISGNTSTAHRDYALAAGADSFLAKPFALADLLGAVHQLCPLPQRRFAALAGATA